MPNGLKSISTNFLRKVRKVEKGLFESYRAPQLESPSLVVGWHTHDVGKLSYRVIHFLNEKLGGQEIAEIKPSGFFSLGGAIFKDNLIQVPESKFWTCKRSNLLIFESAEPEYEWYKFLNAVLDFAQHYCQARELYTISGTVSLAAHTTPREILAVYNQPEFQKRLQGYGLEDMTWQGAPAISSYLLWLAKMRGIPGMSLWPEIPFYLAAGEDPMATKLTLAFLDRRFNLGLDLGTLDLEVSNQNEKIARLREENTKINDYINRLESGLGLSEEEQMELARGVYEILGG
jgi:proteasome assembly chaperone (PAC2) family protein